MSDDPMSVYQRMEFLREAVELLHEIVWHLEYPKTALKPVFTKIPGDCFEGDIMQVIDGILWITNPNHPVRYLKDGKIEYLTPG